MRDIYVGRTAEGDRVRLNLELEEKSTPEPHQSIDHREANTVLELSMSVDITDRAGREAGGGQAIETLREVAAPGGRADGPYSSAQILRLADLWERHHLNGLIPGCIHQDDTWYCTAATSPNDPMTEAVKNGWPVIYARFGSHPYPKRGDECYLCGRNRWDEPSDFCPVTGYHFGSAWLSYAIPADDLAELRAFERQGLAGAK